MAATVVEAVIDRLVDQLPNGVKFDSTSLPVAGQIAVYDGYLPDAPATQQYVVVFGGTGVRESGTIDGTSDEITNAIQAKSIVYGDSALLMSMCRWLSKRVRDALTDWAPVADEIVHAGLIRHHLSIQPRYDEDVKAYQTVYADDRFEVIGSY